MASELSPKQRSALNRVAKDPSLEVWLFRKAKGLIWFNAFKESGFLNKEKLPSPTENEDGTISIPGWPILEYIVASSVFLQEPENSKYVQEYLDFILECSQYSKEKGFSNYRVWWQFSKVLQNIPVKNIDEKLFCVISYWLTDRYERGLVGDELIKLMQLWLDENTSESRHLASSIAESIFDVKLIQEDELSKSKRITFACQSYRLEKKIPEIAKKIGNVLQLKGALIFKKKLEHALKHLGRESFSSMWRPAIEDHKQNSSYHKAENILIIGLREATLSFIDSNEKPAESEEFISQLISSDLVTLQRIGLYAIDKKFEVLSKKTKSLVIDKKYFESNYRHETWWFLKNNFDKLTLKQKNKVYDFITEIQRFDENHKLLVEATAYNKSIWMSAIKACEKKASVEYDALVKISGTEPDHPDFSSYMSVGSSVHRHESPISSDELSKLLDKPEKLLNTLNSYDPPKSFMEPGLEGLAKAFKQLVINSASSFDSYLNELLELKHYFLNEIFRAYQELWEDIDNKNNVNWKVAWPRIFDFSELLVKNQKFWDVPTETPNDEFVGNRLWIIGSLSRLIESGCKDDKRSFALDNISSAKVILEVIIKKQQGTEFDEDSDAVSVAINSPKGQALDAYINLALFECRTHGKNTKERKNTWEKYAGVFNSELHKADYGEYEFATLVGNYIPNFLYLSKEWVLENLDVIFDDKNHLRWLCVMQGYSYINQVYKDVYIYLKDKGYIIKALDDDQLKKRVTDRFIDFIALTYVWGDESLSDENDLIYKLIERNQEKEIDHLIWILWTFRNDQRDRLREKVYDLWDVLNKKIDFSTKQGKKLASRLIYFSSYIEELDAKRVEWLSNIAEYAEIEHNASHLIEVLANLSTKQPIEAASVMKIMLRSYFYPYPEEAFKSIFTNLIESGNERDAKDIVGEFIKFGDEKVKGWFDEVQGNI